jgi:hypothetical protein
MTTVEPGGTTPDPTEYRNEHERALAARIERHRQEAAEANDRRDGPRTRQEARQLKRLIHQAYTKMGRMSTTPPSQGHGAPSALARRIAHYQKTKRAPKKFKRNRSWQ